MENFSKLVTGAQVTQVTRLVGPTLVLGLGGTGKDVLLRMRRLIVEHYGRLDDLPFLRFLHMDTDQTEEARQQYDIKADDDPLYDLVRFDKNELVDLRIPGGTGNVIKNIEAYPQIKGWFQTKGRMHNLGDLGKGAGQIRMASRLAFYLKINQIKSAFQKVGNDLMQADVATAARKMQFSFDQDKRNIFVVGSLAGGTGSGVFLDAGFLLKAELGGFSRAGFFVLPSVFNGFAGENRMKANGYAALMELNHYSFGHSFPTQWDQTASGSIPPPPYDYTYLVDAENAAGTMAKPNELYQMIAESLFHEFSLGAFADKKRSVRVNLIQFTQNAYVHSFWQGFEGTSGTAQKTMVGDSFTLRFSSFGQSSIFLPMDKLLGACASRLGREIIELWQQQAGQSLLEDLYTRFLSRPEINFAQGSISLKDGGHLEAHQLEDALSWQNKDAGKTYREYFWGKIMELMGNLQALPMKSKADALDSFVADIESWFGRENSDREDDWGQVPRDIAATAREYRIAVQRGIEKECDRLANDPHYGIAYTLALLRELRSTLHSDLEVICYTNYFDNNLASWTDTTQYYKGQLDSVARDLRKRERQILFRADDVRNDLDLLAKDSDEDRGILDNYLYARTARLVFGWGKKICESVDGFLGEDSVDGSGLIARYRKLLHSLDTFKQYLSTLNTYFKRSLDYSNAANLIAQSDFDRWYNIWAGGDAAKPNFKPRLEEYSNDILHSVFQADSVSKALETILKSSRDAISYQLLKRCKELLVAAGQGDGPSVLKALFEGGISQTEREEYVRHALTMAKSWVHSPSNLGQIGDAANVPAQQQEYYIGLDTTDPFASEFEKIVRRVSDSSDNWKLISLGGNNKSSIVFFHELSGIPAFYPHSVTAMNGLRYWYQTYFVDPQKLDPNNQDVLHTHKNRFLFEDIIPKKSEQVEQYKYAVRSFTVGRVCNILNISNGEEGLRYRYVDNSNAYRPPDIIDIGQGESDAIDFLYQRDQSPDQEKIYFKISNKIDGLIEALQKRNLLPVYYLILEFYRSFVYQPKTDKDDVPGLNLKCYLPQYAAISLEITRIDGYVARLGLADRLAAARDRLVSERLFKPKMANVQENLLSEDEKRKAAAQLDHDLKGIINGTRRLTEEEYRQILQPYCIVSGHYTKYGVQNVVGGQVSQVCDAMVLDYERLIDPDAVFETGSQAPSEPAPVVPPTETVSPAASQASPRASVASEDSEKVQCPHCQELVLRGAFCSACGKPLLGL